MESETRYAIGNEEESEDEELLIAISEFHPHSDNQHQLALNKGQAVRVLKKSNENWWWANVDGREGYVPVSYLNKGKQVQWQDEEYFGNYGNLKLHQEMLADKQRTEAYLNAIVNNAECLQHKVILDVGCGTGILSMLCAKHAQPKKVYAVEASDMALHTQQLVEKNNLTMTVKVLHAFAEDAELDEPVDLIVSEWMGTFLLFEMMIEAVITMRDRYLKPGGTIWPSTANLILVPCCANDQYKMNMEFWDSQYGLDFSYLRGLAKDDLIQKPKHDYVLPRDDCLALEQEILKLNIRTVAIEDLEEQTCKFEFTVQKDETMHGFCAWFEVEFHPLSKDADMVSLNTGPDHALTHWKQDLFLLDEPILVNCGDVISGHVTISRNPKFRRHLRASYDFSLTSPDNETQNDAKHIQKMFYIWR
ncbi:protein arginine N-methyltransferase 2-like [Mya arenaria]|uniref:protein arginine N-methyltransferase 2-like n=1 Tax=Mya arenaria TaxID=6604 RepID=UPI0022E5404B|nr:protein arginine N-methyltransferase 2-like [Mya arenaria]